MSPVAALLASAFALSVALAMWRGIDAAGGFSFGWFQGYHEPMNSLRLAKPFFLALLLWPLWVWPARESPMRTADLLAWGMVGGLAAVSVAVLWERLAFTGLLNFGSDYRSTALFWEMHVGGAAIDGFLALSLPFALAIALRERRPRLYLPAAIILLAGLYAALTTFSRALYLAVPAGMCLMLVFDHAPQRTSLAEDRGAGRAMTAGVLMCAAFAAGAWMMFPTSGYRGMLALLGAVAVLLSLTSSARPRRASQVLAVCVLGAALVALGAVIAMWLPHGPYLAYALIFAIGAGALAALRMPFLRLPSVAIAAPVALAAFFAIVAMAALVARHWGGVSAMDAALPVLVALVVLAVLSLVPQNVPWPSTGRWQLGVLVAMAMSAAVIGVFAGGSVMSDRFSERSSAWSARMQHWREGFSYLRSQSEWLLGKGLGRFPAEYFIAHVAGGRPGDWRWATDASGPYLALSAGRHPIGWLETMRISQRIPLPQAPLSLDLQVRAETQVGLSFEVCEKHLLYSSVCLSNTAQVVPTHGGWHKISLALAGERPRSGPWYAPRLIVFSLALIGQGQRADVRHIVLTSSDGTALLDNGDFSRGLSRWFMTSDGFHQPWHLEGIFTGTLFDQGIVGATLLALMLIAALWRLLVGAARTHPLSPMIAGALLGFLVVGVFSSVVDVPRIALLFYLLLLISMSMAAPRT
ncbi:MAG TPA: hypothetical protein VFP68_23875, partial [Burkholderiaceae bacterium]|nr:hypothetical protein [Burkholderiaceae bacterium]